MGAGFGSARAYNTEDFDGSDRVAARTQFSVVTNSVSTPATFGFIIISVCGLIWLKRRV